MRIRRIAAAGAAAAALSLGVALPAFAHGHTPAFAHGHTGVAAPLAKGAKVWVYQDANFQNRRTTFTENMWNLKKDGWDNTISSAKNVGKRCVTFYSDPYFHGVRLTLAPGDSEAHFGNHKGMSDATSSVKFR